MKLGVRNLFILLFIFFITLFFWAYKYKSYILNITNLYKNPDAHLSQNINIEADGYIIYNLKDNIILKAENENKSYALASLTKVIIIGAYLEYKKEKGEEINKEMRDVIDKILIESDNNSIENLNQIFIAKNNLSLLDLTRSLAERLNISSEIQITNPSGLDIDKVQASNFGTPLAIAKIYSYLYKEFPETFQSTKFSVSKNDKEILINTNKDSDKTFGILSSKTGYTDVAGGNLAVIVTPSPDSEYLLIVFNSSKTGRFTDIAKLNSILPILIKIK